MWFRVFLASEDVDLRIARRRISYHYLDYSTIYTITSNDDDEMRVYFSSFLIMLSSKFDKSNRAFLKRSLNDDNDNDEMQTTIVR